MLWLPLLRLSLSFSPLTMEATAFPKRQGNSPTSGDDIPEDIIDGTYSK
jgi:hypothetical protein